jgi:glycosyltransferase involved in cell wall biosynthesis
MIHVLAWDNVDQRIIDAQKSVLDHFKIDYTLHRENVDHGQWMNSIMESSTDEVVGFLDVDCVPLNSQIVPAAQTYCVKNKSFIGIAQVSNHIPPAAHIYAAPAFFFINRQAWHDLDKPTFAVTVSSDVAENVSYAAEERGLPYRALYPVKCAEPLWRLGNYGMYGIGTEFIGGIYHLYQSRMSENMKMFERVCEEVVSNEV